jgi:DNA-binding NtrC family response regulator
VPRGTDTVLLVEGEEGARSVAREALELYGYSVIEASGGGEAVSIFERADDVRLVVTDVVMPDMGGRELAKRLLGRRPGLYVLYMSGYTDNAIVSHSILYEGTNFIQKPFTPAALARKVREVFDAAGRRPEPVDC